MGAPIDLTQVNDRDWFLQNLINMVNGQEVEVGITLNVGGFLISGQLVSGHKYFEAFGTGLGSTFTDKDARQTLVKSFEQFGDLYRSDNSEVAVAPPNYVHLKGARFFNTSGQPVPDNGGVWWRGRVSEVGGFFLGALNA